MDTNTVPLTLAREARSGLSYSDMATILSQIRGSIHSFYAHLPHKVTSLAIDPIRKLELLKDDVGLLSSEEEYWFRIFDIFLQLRDRHTFIRRPTVFQSQVAFLPFSVESCWDEGRRKLIVSKVLPSVEDPHFVPGVEISHWNGQPIRFYVERLSWQTLGANPSARILLALRSLTARPLAFMSPPDEDWVQLTFRDARGDARAIQFAWAVHLSAPGSRVAGFQESAGLEAATAVGVDESLLQVNSIYQDLAQAKRPGAPEGDLYQFEVLRERDTKIGYLRIFSFNTNVPQVFVRDISDTLRDASIDALIIDIRANPGGNITAGEGLLSVFRGGVPSFCELSFRATAHTRATAEALGIFSDWSRSLRMVLMTGEEFSQEFALTSAPANEGYRFTGPVCLIMDALSYSTSDFFAAGFQDNAIGLVLCVDGYSSGGGGANVWPHALISQFSKAAGFSGFEPLPGGADLNVAVRRARRSGPNSGIPLEGLGVVVPKHDVYLPTKRDVLGRNDDLIAYASTRILGRSVQPARS